MKKFFSTFLIFILVFSCSSSDGDSDSQSDDIDPVDPIVALPSLTTQNPTFEGADIRLNGTIVSEGDGVSGRGFCWAENTNPTLEDSFQDASGSGIGPYFVEFNTFGVFEAGETYNVRAYAQSSENFELVYGNNITFTMPEKYAVTIDVVRNIQTLQADFMAEVTTTDPGTTDVVQKGFVINTTGNPSIGNGTTLPNANDDLGEFNLTQDGLTYAQDYFLVAYAYDGDEYFYSDVVTFRTMGDIGPSGGYVFFDKGETSEGWRYLEAAPADLVYNGSTQIKWGCTGTNISQTFREIGFGLENTELILQGCSDANCAARRCDIYTVNGLDDWFLPSLDEMGLLHDSINWIIDLGNNNDQTHWTSTQYNSNQARNFNTHFGFAPGFGVSKSLESFVRPVRRF